MHWSLLRGLVVLATGLTFRGVVGHKLQQPPSSGEHSHHEPSNIESRSRILQTKITPIMVFTQTVRPSATLSFDEGPNCPFIVSTQTSIAILGGIQALLDSAEIFPSTKLNEVIIRVFGKSVRDRAISPELLLGVAGVLLGACIRRMCHRELGACSPILSQSAKATASLHRVLMLLHGTPATPALVSCMQAPRCVALCAAAGQERTVC